MKETTTYAQIVKTDKNSDGTLTVYGKATDDSLDIDHLRKFITHNLIPFIRKILF